MHLPREPRCQPRPYPPATELTKFACDAASAIAGLFAGAAEPTETPSIPIAPARKSESENILILVSPGFAFAIVGVKQMLARRIGTRQRTENPPQRFL